MSNRSSGFVPLRRQTPVSSWWRPSLNTARPCQLCTFCSRHTIHTHTSKGLLGHANSSCVQRPYLCISQKAMQMNFITGSTCCRLQEQVLYKASWRHITKNLQPELLLHSCHRPVFSWSNIELSPGSFSVLGLKPPAVSLEKAVWADVWDRHYIVGCKKREGHCFLSGWRPWLNVPCGMEDLACQTELTDVATGVWGCQQVRGRLQKYGRPLSIGELTDMRKDVNSTGMRHMTFRSTTNRIYDGGPIIL